MKFPFVRRTTVATLYAQIDSYRFQLEKSRADNASLVYSLGKATKALAYAVEDMSNAKRQASDAASAVDLAVIRLKSLS